MKTVLTFQVLSNEIVKIILTFVRRTPVVPVSDPVGVSAVEVPGVVVREDRSVALVDHVLDRLVLKDKVFFVAKSL